MYKSKGIVLTYEEVDELNMNGYLNDYDLLNDTAGYPFGNCVIVFEGLFKEGEIRERHLADRVQDIYYCVADIEFDIQNLKFTGKWYARNCTGKAIFTERSDAELFEAKYRH